MNTTAHEAQDVLGDVTVPASGPAYWRSAWSLRHTVAAVTAGIALFVALLSARENAGALEVAVFAVAALMGAVTLATYVPPAGVPAREHLTGGSCGIIPALATVAAPFMLSQAPATGFALVALLACCGVAAAKRITDHASC